MIFDDTLARATYGWASPNEAATFLATLVPFVWAALLWGADIRHRTTRRIWYAALWTAEGFLYLLLAATASRGGVLALAGAGLFFGAVAVRSGALPAKTLLRELLARGAVLVLVLIAAGAAQRFSPDALLGDRSGEIRLDLWKAGLRMLYLEPWSGWGPGQSGLQYMHWFQATDDPKRVAGMIQSFLHIGVERGMPALWLFATGLFFGPLLAWRIARAGGAEPGATLSAACAAAGAAGTAWIIGNALSTQWIIPGLWIVPTATNLGVIVFALIRISIAAVGRVLLAAALAGILLCAGSYFVGALIRHHPNVDLENGWVQLEPSPNTARGSGWLILPDRDVLGREYGRELRRLIAEKPGLVLHAPRDPADLPPSASFPAVLATGTHANAALRPGTETIFILHPAVRPDPGAADALPPGAEVTLFLPDLDVGGYGDLWRKAARQRNWTIVSTGWTGPDLRAKWPGALLPYLD